MPITDQWSCRACGFDRYHQIDVIRKDGRRYLTSFYACSRCSGMFLNPQQWCPHNDSPPNVAAPPDVVIPIRRRRR